jgi:hypothetical protein
MKITFLSPVTLILAFALPAFGSVAVSSPSNNTSVAPSTKFVASASTTCSKGVAAVGVYVDNKLEYVANGAALNTTIALTPGKHNVAVQEWDFCGGATNTPLTLTVPASAGISVSAPVTGSTVSNPATFVASATTNCATGVAAMGVYVNGVLAYKVNGTSISAPVTLPVGTPTIDVQEWDNCGGSTTAPVNVTVTGTTLKNIHLDPGWNQWGELSPKYDICNAPCTGVTWTMAQNQTDITTSGSSTKFVAGGTTPYSDILWSDPVIGQGNKKNLTDANHVLLPTLHNFILDTDVYISNLAVTQDLEFDINMFANGVGMEWGTECNHLDGGVWDIWDNVDAKWVHTTIPCVLNDKAWNHVTLQVQRLANNQLLYQSITVNGVTTLISQTVAPFSVPTGWWGMTVNYQMDGDYKMHTNTTYLDKTNFTYW